MSDQAPARVMGAVWMAMGAVCLVAPRLVLSLSLHERLQQAVAASDDGDPASQLMLLIFRCFGAQAVMTGLVLCVARFDRRGYRLFGAGVLPFFVFDLMAWRASYLSAFGALGDLAGNVVFTAGAAIGAGRAAKASAAPRRVPHQR